MSENPYGLGWAMNLATEMVVATLVGGGIGYALDQWWRTWPWMSLFFLLCGVVAGFSNVYRAANQGVQLAAPHDGGGKGNPPGA